jgi:hypothetical protein
VTAGGPTTLFSLIGERLERLIPRFGLEAEAGRVRAAFALIGHESLALPPGRQAPELCRINRDGTAFQLALAFRRGQRMPLQFLGEAAPPGSSMEDRFFLGLERMAALADLLGAASKLPELRPVLDRQAPAGDRALLENPSGIFWLGARFDAQATPSVTIYINPSWGEPADQWLRLAAFADFFGQAATWETVLPTLRSSLAPRGLAVTVGAGRPTSGRIYLGGYGLSLPFCRDLLLAWLGDAAFGAAFDRQSQAILGEDRAYPLRSVTCSFELGPAGPPGAKLEFCAHCALDDDASAARRCAAWLASEGLEVAFYREVVSILMNGRELPAGGPPELHAYLGFGRQGGQDHATIYLNPGPALVAR